jgi:hypothetical protein
VSSEIYQAWLQKLHVELKGKSLDSFDYRWHGHIISPFAERKRLPGLELPKWNAGWKIGALVEAQNKSILDALEYGPEVICLAASTPNLDWKKIWKGIEWAWVQIDIDQPRTEDLEYWKQMYRAPKLSQLRGTCLVRPDLQESFYETHREHFPGLRFLGFELRYDESPDDIARKYWNLLNRIESLADRYDLANLIKSVYIRFYTGHEFVLNIAMLRAIRWTWMQLLVSIDRSFQAIPLEVQSIVTADSTKKSDNQIMSTISGLAAVIGMTDTLYIQSPEADSQRSYWPIKTQYILREESKMHRTKDPLNGSYIIERLTELITEKVCISIAAISSSNT